MTRGSRNSVAGAGPEIRARGHAEPDSLAHAVLAGEGPISPRWGSALDPTALPSPRRSRLGPDAFGSSGSEARRRLDAVLRGEGVFVTTGHQPVLLLGPFYVLYKALTAISLAARLERALGHPVVPLFWIAADDHDWAEVGRVRLLDRTDEMRTLALPVPQEDARRPVGPHPLSAAMQAALEPLSDILPESEFTSSYAELVRDAYAPGRTLADAFARLLHGVLGDRGYAWLDSSHSEVCRAAAPLYRRMFDDPEAVLAAEAAGARTLAEAGFEPPITSIPDALPLFYDDGGGRHRVKRDGDGFRAGPGESAGGGGWRARLDATPSRFSPNVASRPVLESYLLPVAATVLGPGEIAYWSQLPPLFEALGDPLPAVHPRASWTLVEPRIRRILTRAGVSARELAGGADAVVARLTREARPADVEEALRGLREGTEAGLAEVEGAVAEHHPGLRAAAGKARKGMLGHVAALSRQVDREARRRLDTRLVQIRRAAANLHPGGRPQERMLNPLPLLCRYGPALVNDLARETDRRLVDEAEA